jgi:hypothetical protein
VCADGTRSRAGEWGGWHPSLGAVGAVVLRARVWLATEASGAGEVGGGAGGARQPPGGPDAASRAATAACGPDRGGLVAVAGQLGAAVTAAGHGHREGPAQPAIEVDDDAAAHRRPPPRAT